jgi:UDP-galactopyranose mutase
MKYDYLIVGAGMFGATFAREMMDVGKTVLILDKREHIGGNCYTEDREGVDVHVYGPHIFHTNDKKIWQFVNRFAEFNQYINKPKVNFRGKIYSFPINLMTLYQLWGVTTPKEAKKKLDEVRIPCENPQNLEEWILSQVGREVYETFIKGYTMKQWKRHPSELPASIIKRLPIRLIFEENYFFDKYQGIPIGGYTNMINRMLKGADVRVGIDYLEDREAWNSLADRIVFTGKIDEFFGYQFGYLEYRSLKFDHEVHDGDYQGNAVVNYTDYEVPYTRIVEHKHFQPQTAADIKKTVITKEYPQDWTPEKVPYYPVNDKKNGDTFKKYSVLARNSNIIFGGRLAEYRYYDMHQVVGSALQKARKELERNGDWDEGSL